jgi:hypothetical protein
MNLRVYLFSLFIGFLVAFGVWLLILFNIDPFKTDFLSIAAFYASLFIWLSSLISLINYFVRLWFNNKEVVYANLTTALRQGMLISLIVVGLLILEQLNVLNWWVGGIWSIVVLLTELFFNVRGDHEG